jgi:uncharacterized membrane protein
MKTNVKTIGRSLIAFAFICTGILHFVRPRKFLKIMPEIPYKKEAVYVSGFFEILGGLGLLVPWTRSLAGKGLVALLVAVFPANINMAVKKIDFGKIPQWLLWMRLPLQFLLIKLVQNVSRD